MAEILRNQVVDAITERRSIRSYKNTQISGSEIATILEAGIWAPTASNRQQICFYVIQDKNKISSISAGFSKFSFDDGKIHDFSYGAPTLIMLFGKTGGRFMEVDAGIAAENMSLAAHCLGLGSLIIGCIKDYIDSEEGRKYAVSLGIPEDQSFGIALALGYTNAPTPPRPRLEGRIKYIN